MASKQSAEISPISMRAGLRVSLALHGAVLVLFFFQSLWAWFFPVNMTSPSLRVDVVDLPDMLKKDLEDALLVPTTPNREKLKTRDSESAEKVEDEMVERPKKLVDRKKKIANALDRLKALQNVDPDDEAEKSEAELEKRILSKKLKGNQLSQGTSTSGDAREGGPAGYPDKVKVKMRLHWNLPIWLKRQSLSAQVRITIDSRGRIATVEFVKPSGSAPFDEYVRTTLNEAQPLPIPPVEMVGTLLTRGVLVGFPL